MNWANARAAMSTIVGMLATMAYYPAAKPNLVVFCGAGFSAGLGIPTMDRFTDHLRTSGFLDSSKLTALDHVQVSCDSLASVIGSSARNLEQLASFLSILERVRPQYRFDLGVPGFGTVGDVRETLLECMAFLARPDLVWEDRGAEPPPPCTAICRLTGC